MLIARPVTSLLRCALAIAPPMLLAVDVAPAPTPTPMPTIPQLPRTAPTTEYTPGRTSMGAGRQVVVQGLLDLDVLQRQNYNDGSDAQSDHRGYGTLRANLGLQLQLDEKATAVIGFGYKSDLGDYGTTNQEPGPTLAANESQRNSAQSQVVLSDAHIKLNNFLNFEDLGVLAGRMPVCWSLLDDRTGKKTANQTANSPERGAFLYDSRANDPVIRSWDGMQVSWTGWQDMKVHPWAYRLPDASSLWGVTVDWTPDTARGSDKVFICGMYSEERKIVLADSTVAPKLRTFSGGVDWRIDEVGLWMQGAGQRGDAGGGRAFNGLGAEVGMNWQFSPYGKGRFQLIGDWLSGDDGSDPTIYRGFVNKWESISDTFIVENEKYGELSKLLVGNLHAIKARWGIGLSQNDEVRFDVTAAHYRLDRELSGGGGREFGTELDVQLRWQYNYWTEVRFFGGVFKPGGAMTTAQEARAAALGSPITAGMDPIWLAGINMYVAF